MPAPRPTGLRGARSRNLAFPVVVGDWKALDQSIDAYISRASAAPRTRDAYSDRWAAWERHCTAEGADPWASPADVFMALWLRRNDDGSPASYNTIDGIASAVKHHYGLRGLTPAYKLPAHAGTWRDLRRAAKKAQSRREEEKGTEALVVPLLRAQAVALVASKPTWSEVELVRKAAVLLGLGGMRPGRLDRLRADEVELLEDGGVVLDSQLFACDHEQRATGVPWDCAACAVRDALAFVPSDGPLLDGGKYGWVNYFPPLRQRSRHLAAAKQPWGPREGLTDWEMAGLRRGLVLSCAKGCDGVAGLGLRWVRARAWTAAAWACGLRMASDTDGLDRQALRPDADGRGWTLTLGSTKDDQVAAKQVTRAFPCADLVAQALAEYACVRDALTSADGPLFTDLVDKGPARYIKAPVPLAASDLALLAILAGLEPVYTSYSTRKGYAAQATADGWSLEDIRDGLRHLHLTTTVSHYLPGHDAQAVERRLVGRLELDARAGESE